MILSAFRRVPIRLGAALAALVVLLAVTAVPTSSASIDNKGTEFIAAFLPNYNYPSYPSEVEIHLTGDTATNVAVQYPIGAPLAGSPFSVTPGTVTIVPVPRRGMIHLTTPTV